MLNFFKRDALRVGVAVGVVAPLLIFLTTILVMSRANQVTSYLVTMIYLGSLSKLLSLCVYPNLGLFYLYLRFKRETSAKGVVWGTMIMAIAVALVFFLQKVY